ncbi:hypothetical protein GLOIN_2v1773466 [Rhizophagus clarus]|uniref:Uncharacterized protein n=3 Tax=Rhizophagus clarus TaxID=94130 RepID=A0A8H3QYD2_9GLOM|nr:hypothetical protein GLOIN_2v1773466 [Rhizophagus clarus]
MEKGLTTVSVNKQVLEECITKSTIEFFFEEIIDIFPKLLRNTSNNEKLRKFILKCLKDHDWSTIKELQQEKYRFGRRDYSLEIYGFFLALSRHVSSSVWTYILMENDIYDASDDSDNITSNDEPLITVSSSSTAANKSKLVITQQAPEEEMDISFTKEDQSATEKSSPTPSSTQEKGKSLRRKDNKPDIYDEDKANYIVIGFQPSPTSKAFPASWSLKERKERERYQVVIKNPLDDMNTTTLALKENINSLIQRDIRMFKEIKFSDGSRKIIGYLLTWDSMKECIDIPMIWNGASLTWSCHLSPSNNKAAYKQTKEIKTSKQSTINVNLQISSHKLKTVGIGSNRIPIGNRRDSKQPKKTKKEIPLISKSTLDSTKKSSSKKPQISKRKLAADIATIIETLNALVR